MENLKLIRIESQGKSHLINLNHIDHIDYYLTETSYGTEYVIEIYIASSFSTDYRFFDPLATDLWNYFKSHEIKVFDKPEYQIVYEEDDS